MRALTALAAACAVLLSANTARALEERHVGTVGDALVAVEVVSRHHTGVPESTRRANGFVLRCDGFVLAPADVFAQSADTTSQAVSVVLYPGTAKERRIVGVPLPRWMPSMEDGYVAFRVEGVHVPALRTRLIGAREKVVLVSRRWDPKGDRFGPLRRVDAESQPASGQNERGVVHLAVPVPDIVPGTVVLGEDGLAVGMVTGSMEGTATGFLSFAALDRITNCVTPVPTTDEAFRQAEAKLPPEQRMVPVAGGTIALPAELQREQPDTNGGREACVAPFQIDRYEVTNGE